MKREIISLVLVGLVMSGCGGSVTADRQSLEEVAQEQESIIASERSKASPIDMESVNSVQEKLPKEGE